uniref:Uncharacterized protein n=1 Tax=Rhizophora mucronata TaxID=61149 RepID=A0A2P2NBA7_RHIMU
MFDILLYGGGRMLLYVFVLQSSDLWLTFPPVSGATYRASL